MENILEMNKNLDLFYSKILMFLSEIQCPLSNITSLYHCVSLLLVKTLFRYVIIECPLVRVICTDYLLTNLLKRQILEDVYGRKNTLVNFERK